MFGLKFRSWMESHIVRPRKKQQQQQQQQQLQQQQQAGAAAAAVAGRGAKAFGGGGGGKAAGAAPGGGRGGGGGRPLGGAPGSPGRATRDRDAAAQAASASASASASAGGGGGGISLLAHAHQRGTAHSLSSPESAYSTGYSTDGTSPGASFPPEYYINLRTGTHYFHSSAGATGGGAAAAGAGAAAAAGAQGHPPHAAYHLHQHHHQPFPPQHPRLVQVSEGAGVVPSHRRTESYDECRRAPLPVPVPVPPGGGPPLSRASYALPDEYSSPPATSAAPSPRQRNRIRTNPWLAGSSLSSSASSSSAGRGAHQPQQQGAAAQRPLESSSGSDATLPRRANDAAAAATAAATAGRAWGRQGATPTPPAGSRGSASASASPAPAGGGLAGAHGPGSAVTSPRRASLCSSTSSSTVSSASSCGVGGGGGPGVGGGSSAASSGCGARACVSAPVGRTTLSAHLSLSADEHDELELDALDDEDDLTLNEMLGKFDESYVYEKETDILSDSDPTDCDEDTDFDTGQECGDDDGDVDGDDEDEGEAGSGEADGGGDLADEEELDFIDNGSCVDVDAADERRRPPRNRGHCTYHMPADLLPPQQQPPPQQQQAVAVAQTQTQPARKPSGRYRESFLRRSSARRHSAARALHAASEQAPAAAAAADAASATGSPLPVARQHSSRRSAEDGFPVGRRSSSRHHHHHHMQQAHGQPGSRNSSEKKRPSRCSVRRSANNSIRERQHESDHDRDRERERPSSASRTAAVGSPLPKHNGIHHQQQVHPQQYSDRSTEAQLGPSVMNLNKVLMQKMLERTGVTGTRSAGNTPISLRRRILEGEGVPLSPSKLINKNIRPLHPMNCNTGVNGNWNQDVSPKMITDVYCSPQKQRSNSVSSTVRRSDIGCGGIYGGGNGLMRSGARGNANYLATFSSEMALVEADKEADRKYRELILEAENILVSMKGGITDKTTNFMLPKPKPYFLNSNYLNDNCLRTKPPAKLKNSANEETTALNSGPRSELRSPPEILRSRTTSPKRIAENHNEDQDLQNGNTFSITEEDSFKRHKESDKILSSPRKRQNRNIRSMPVQGSSSSESDGSSTPHQEDVTFSPKIPVSASTNNFQRPALTTFRSIDIGNAADGSRYCPQSEPVKRKVYTCSATFDRLQKSLEKSQHTSFRQKSGSAKNTTNEGEKSGRESLKEKLEQLRKERLEVEAKVREAQEDERRRFDDKRQFSLLRRQMLVHTIEGLKKSLEDQSAKLQETYQPDIEVPVSNRRHSSSSIGLQQEPDCIEDSQ